MKHTIFILSTFFILTSCTAIDKDSALIKQGLILDLNANEGLTLEDGSYISNWKNQVKDFNAQDFVKRDKGRKVAGSGRPLLVKSSTELNGHNSIVFKESELVNMNEDAFDHLITGSGYTWLVVMKPYKQTGKLKDVNAFLGNLQNGKKYEGIWAGLEDDSTLWAGSRNGLTFGRWDKNNPKLVGPKLENKFYILAGRQQAGTKEAIVDLFVNSSTPVSSKNTPVNPKADSSKLAIGTERDAIQHPGKESFDGEIARILIYERPLSDDELKNAIESLKQTYLK